MLKLYKELKRRKVLKNLGVYGAGAFVIIQVADIVFERLLLPDWTVTFVIILAILGFPIALFLSWTYDLKRETKTDNKSESDAAGWDKDSKKSLLPLTGLLTIIGGAFWVLYSLGDISTGSQLDLQMGINKSIAVFNFENLTGQNEGDHFCSGISEHIRSVLTGIGKLDVKSRHAILNNNPKDLELDYYNLIKSHYSIIGIAPVPDPKRFGIIEMADGQIVKFWEKPENPPSNMALIGIYYISSQTALAEGVEYLMENNIRTNNEYQLTDAFTVMVDNGHQFKALEIDNCLDCGIPETLLSTNCILLERRNKNDIHKTAIIKNSNICHCTISENCHVADSKLNNVIMLTGSKVLHQNIDNAIVGYDKILGKKSVETIKN